MRYQNKHVALAALCLAVVAGLFVWRASYASTDLERTQAAAATPVATRTATVAATPTPAPTRTTSPAASPTASAAEASDSTAITSTAASTATATSTSTATSTLPAAAAISLEDLAEYNGIPVGFTAEGHPFMGNPDAPVRMDEFSDYLCPFCGRHFLETTPALIDEYVLTGKLMYVFRDFPIPSLHPNAPEGHQAARCVGQDDAVGYWTMHDALFARQNEWNQLPDVSDFLASVAADAGADPAVYEACMDSGETIARVDADIEAGNALGFTGTPTFVFSGDAFTDTYTLVGAYPVDAFRQWIDAMVAGEAPPQEAQAPEPQLPFWASEEGLAPDPERAGHTMAGDPYKGSEEAPLTIIEFSDFQCPACENHANNVQATLDEQFVETGQVRWVFKNRPLVIHPLAPLAAAAAECAADQGQFWEMHEAIFANVAKWAPDEESWTVDDAVASLNALAKETELDADSFSECLDGREAMERVLFDVFDSEGVVTSTPTFIALYGGQGTILNGSRPAADFVAVLESLVAAAEEAAASEE